VRESGDDCSEAVGKRAALVADLFLGAEVLVGVGVGGLVDGCLDHVEGDDLLGFGLALDHDLDAFVGALDQEGDLLAYVGAAAAFEGAGDVGLVVYPRFLDTSSR
jgi:hypothetical protein